MLKQTYCYTFGRELLPGGKCNKNTITVEVKYLYVGTGNRRLMILHFCLRILWNQIFLENIASITSVVFWLTWSGCFGVRQRGGPCFLTEAERCSSVGSPSARSEWRPSPQSSSWGCNQSWWQMCGFCSVYILGSAVVLWILLAAASSGDKLWVETWIKMHKQDLQLDRKDNAGHTEQNDTNPIIINGPETSLACQYRALLHSRWWFSTGYANSVISEGT